MSIQPDVFSDSAKKWSGNFVKVSARTSKFLNLVDKLLIEMPGCTNHSGAFLFSNR